LSIRVNCGRINENRRVIMIKIKLIIIIIKALFNVDDMFCEKPIFDMVHKTGE